jgi:hypothetical protein
MEGPMRPLSGYITLAVVAVTAVPVAASAQDSTIAQRRQAAMVLDQTFDAPIGAPVRVFLAKGVTYRAEVQGNTLQLQLKPLLASTQQPLIQPLLSGNSAGNERLYTIKPRADAEYAFTPTGGESGRPVRLRVYAMPVKDKP